MAGNPIILTTTNFSNLFSEIYSVLHPGTGENNGNVGKVLQVGSNGKVTFTSDIVTGTGLSTLEARVSANESAITGKASSADLSALATRVTATENSLSGKVDSSGLNTTIDSRISTALTASGSIQTAINNSVQSAADDLRDIIDTKTTLTLGDVVTALNTTSPTAGSTPAKLQTAVQDHADTVINTELGSTGTIGTALTSATANLASVSYVTTAVSDAKTELSVVNADSGLANVLGFSKGTSATVLNGSDGTALSRSAVTNVKGYIDAGDSELSTKMGTAPTGTTLSALKANLGITANGDVDIWQAIQAISTKIGDSTAVKPSDLGMSTTYDS